MGLVVLDVVHRCTDLVRPDADRRGERRAHVASAFFVSPFEQAAVLSVDGFGDFASTMLAVGRGNRFEVLDRVLFPHSLGIFYTALTQWSASPSTATRGR